MNSPASDLRYAARELRRRPGFTLTAVLSLALGAGATSAVFSVIYAVLIDPFPYVGADRMMQLSLKDTAGRNRGVGILARGERAGLNRLARVPEFRTQGQAGDLSVPARRAFSTGPAPTPVRSNEANKAQSVNTILIEVHF